MNAEHKGRISERDDRNNDKGALIILLLLLLLLLYSALFELGIPGTPEAVGDKEAAANGNK